jgi:hypothetical protein
MGALVAEGDGGATGAAGFGATGTPVGVGAGAGVGTATGAAVGAGTGTGVGTGVGTAVDAGTGDRTGVGAAIGVGAGTGVGAGVDSTGSGWGLSSFRSIFLKKLNIGVWGRVQQAHARLGRARGIGSRVFYQSSAALPHLRCQSGNIAYRGGWTGGKGINSCDNSRVRRWKIRLGWDKFGSAKSLWTGSIMNFANFCRRVIIGDQAVSGGASGQRTGAAWLFIALVALFLTHPDAEPRSYFDRPLPLPAELNLE